MCRRGIEIIPKDAEAPSGAAETLITIHGPGEFTGEVNMLSGRRTLVRMRATKPGKVIELDRQHMMALIQSMRS